MNTAEVAMLIVALLAAFFAAEQSRTARQADRTANDANRIAKRALEQTNSIAAVKTKVDDNLTSFRASCRAEAEGVLTDLSSIASNWATIAGQGELTSDYVSQEWAELRVRITRLRTLFRTTRNVSALTEERISSVFNGPIYDEVAVKVGEIRDGTADEDQIDALSDLEMTVDRFVASIQALLDAAQDNIVGELLGQV